MRRERARLAPMAGVSPSHLESPSQQRMQLACMHPSYATLEGLSLLPEEDRYSIVIGLARSHIMYMLKQNRRAHIESEIERDTPTQGDEPGKNSILGNEMFQPQGPFLHSQVGVDKMPI